MSRLRRGMGMDRIWAPWRMEYIVSDKEAGPCVFCQARDADDASGEYMLYRDEYGFAMLNRYPYTNGHLLVLPTRHVSSPLEMSQAEMGRLALLLQASLTTLNEVMGCDGMNVGMNIGRWAGAGIEVHAHWHIVPRWRGDNNFMPVVAEARVLNQHLDETYASLVGAFGRLEWNGEQYEPR